uniref:Uncharacterized protein n=1 Tax=Panagrolaimus sp. PS1159 TaxID=55785 RepID=A0AC35FKZ3_9BILA
MIGKGDSLDTSLWNSTDIWNDEITTNIIHNCVSYNVAPIPTNNKQCSKFVITSHIYNVTNNNNLLGTVVSKMNVNNDTLDISNDFTSLSNSKFAFNVNFYYTTN